MPREVIERTVERDLYTGDRDPTILDVKMEIEDLECTLAVCGCKKTLRVKFRRMITKLMIALAHEKGVPKRKVLELPRNTVLGKKSKKRFLRLWTWLDVDRRSTKNSVSMTRQPRHRR